MIFLISYSTVAQIPEAIKVNVLDKARIVLRGFTEAMNG